MNHAERKNRALTIKSRFKVIGNQCKSLRKELRQAATADDKKIIIDLEGTKTIESSGIALLVALGNTLSEKKDRIELINLSDDLRKLFEVMRLDTHFIMDE